MEGDFLPYLSAINNSLTSNANVIMASQTSRQDRKFSREMSDLAWQRNLEAWLMQNEYNLPTNQYARQLQGLKDNGLNPNLVYGSSSSIGGAAGAVSPYKFENIHSTAVPRFSDNDPLGQILSTRLLQTQIQAQEANNRLISARADNEEARLPGVRAKSEDAAYRWQRITSDLLGNYDEAIRASIAKEYWTGIKTEHEANIAHYKRDLAFYESAMAEWLNTAEAPGTGMTYRQYMEACKAYLPGAQYEKFKADVLDIASRIAYRAKQGELIDLKKEYQTYLNHFAYYGRTLGNNWVNLLLTGLQEIFPNGFPSINLFGDPPPNERPKRAHERGMAEKPMYGY